MYLEECKGLVCSYFNPLERILLDEEYHSLAKCLLKSYIKQIRCEGLSCFEPTAESTLLEVLTWYYRNCLPELEQRLRVEEKLDAILDSLIKQDRLRVFRDLPSIMSLNTVLNVLSEGLLSEQRKISYVLGTALKLIAYVALYVKVYSSKRRLNGAVQRVAQKLEEREREVWGKIAKPRDLYTVVSEYLQSLEVREYIQRSPLITEKHVYELALKLKEIRQKVYGTS